MFANQLLQHWAKKLSNIKSNFSVFYLTTQIKTLLSQTRRTSDQSSKGSLGVLTFSLTWASDIRLALMVLERKKLVKHMDKKCVYYKKRVRFWQNTSKSDSFFIFEKGQPDCPTLYQRVWTLKFYLKQLNIQDPHESYKDKEQRVHDRRNFFATFCC